MIPPGPWKIEKEERFDCGHCRRSGAIVANDDTVVVLFDPSEGEYAWALDPDSDEARLIAAAPNMLAALRLISASSFLPTVGTTRAAIDAAIAEATGESK